MLSVVPLTLNNSFPSPLQLLTRRILIAAKTPNPKIEKKKQKKKRKHVEPHAVMKTPKQELDAPGSGQRIQC